MRALLLACLLFISPLSAQNTTPRIEHTVFGDIAIEDPLVIDLLDHPVMTRLKGIDQSGAPRYFTDRLPPYSRYIHSVGVYALLKRVGVTEAEQIAGLLHDASHTVFSHTGDWVFQADQSGDSYQDNIHEWYLSKMKVGDVLKPHGLSISEVLHKQDGFQGLEQDYPDMCADRIEYNLSTGLLHGNITQQDVDHIASNLKFEGNKWFFTNPKTARQFANLSLEFTETFWGSAWNESVNRWSGEIIKRAFDLGLFNKDEFHFSTDEPILAKIRSSKDPKIMKLVDMCENYKDHFQEVQSKPYDLETHPKFRVIDPLVQDQGKLVRLTSLDADFKAKYDQLKDRMKSGIKIKFK